MTAWLLVLLATTPDAGAPLIQGSLDKDLVRRVIRANMQQFSGCYEIALQKDPDAKGKVVVGFTIEKDGSVKQAEMKEDTVGNAALSSCLVSKTKSLVFPAPKGGGTVNVSYPFVFAQAK